MKSCLMLIVFLGSAWLNPAARAQQAAPLHGWQESVPNDPDGEPRRHFTLAGRFLAQLEGNPASNPTLLLKCAPKQRSGGKGRFLVGVVVVGVRLKIHYVEPLERKGGISYYPEVRVSYRLDEGEPVNDDWPPRFDKSSVEFEKGDFEKMLRAKTILLTLADKDERQVIMQFDMPETAATPVTSAQVAEACGVPSLKK